MAASWKSYRDRLDLKIVTKVPDSLAIVDTLKKSSPCVIAVDCEGVSLGPTGPLTLLQIGTWTGKVYLFDIQSNKDLIKKGGLKELMESKCVLKVIHDCRNDSGALYHQFGVRIENIFDTQAADTVIKSKLSGQLPNQVPKISLDALCDEHGSTTNPLKDKIRNVYKWNAAYWSFRPLTDEMITYASYDVLGLVPVLYQALNRLLKPEWISLFKDLCVDKILTYIEPNAVKERTRIFRNKADPNFRNNWWRNSNRRHGTNGLKRLQGNSSGGMNKWHSDRKNQSK